jgi:hypothetical protein
VIGTTLGVLAIIATAAVVSSRIIANAKQLVAVATREADVATRDAKAAKDERGKASSTVIRRGETRRRHEIKKLCRKAGEGRKHTSRAC